VTRIGELGTTVAVTIKRSTLQRNIQEDGILHSQQSENLNSYINPNLVFKRLYRYWVAE
jgi:hypothetical protein